MVASWQSQLVTLTFLAEVPEVFDRGRESDRLLDGFFAQRGSMHDGDLLNPLVKSAQSIIPGSGFALVHLVFQPVESLVHGFKSPVHFLAEVVNSCIHNVESLIHRVKFLIDPTKLAAQRLGMGVEEMLKDRRGHIRTLRHARTRRGDAVGERRM